MFQTSKTLLTSNTRVIASGIADSVPKLIDRVRRLGGPKPTIVLIISGSDGQIDGKSGFSNKFLLNHKFYEDSCKLVGTRPEDKDNDIIPLPEKQKRYADAEIDALLRHPLYKDILFNVLIIKHFYELLSIEEISL